MRSIDSSSDLTLGEIDPNGVEYFDVSMVRQKTPPESPKLYGEYAFAVLGVLTLAAACVFAFGCTPVASSRYDPALLYPQGGQSGSSSGIAGIRSGGGVAGALPPSAVMPPAPLYPQGGQNGQGGTSSGGSPLAGSHGGVGFPVGHGAGVRAPVPLPMPGQHGPQVAQCFWPSTAHCDGDLTACEPLNTLRNCGQCGNRCAIPGARVTCRNRYCEMLGCQRHRGDCDFQPFNGCESFLQRDLFNCGACGISCAHLSGSTAGRCEDGECVVAACLPGLGDCNEEPQDGCEQPLNHPAHCGQCDRPCPGRNEDAYCDPNGICRVRGCLPGFARCGGQCVSLSTSENCGACGNRCPRGTRCQAGVCL